MGTELPAVFSNNDEIVGQLLKAGQDTHDYLWQLPLWSPYRSQLKSNVADISSTGSPTGGAITAALFLSEFLTHNSNWIHIDMMAWNLKEKPGRPEGGDAMALRALYAFIKQYVAEKKATPKKPAAKPKSKK